MRTRPFVLLALGLVSFSPALWAQAAAKPPAGQSLPVMASPSSLQSLLQGDPAAWNPIAGKHVGLNRTPPLFDTDEPASLEVAAVDVRVARAGGKLLVRLTWRDATPDAATLAAVPDSPPETRFRKVPTEADDRFFDAAAIMFPSNPHPGAVAPSLQMGDAQDPVQIYYWNAARGAMRMQAQGRSTTRRTGESFPAAGAYQNGQWSVVFELPDLPPGTPLAFAVWNGSQKDRDGRKYFSVWQVLE
ncbi:MAG TPA: ethylbenzene dehydrogenase-related protein [Terriglobales bacterium]|jgi:complex iron-sulfur molybdoenzyme family reductase subunit gamma|nr:ethylbenzene dehydrogenase-related protein [Terriglobales bacterium]